MSCEKGMKGTTVDQDADEHVRNVAACGVECED